MHDPCDPYIPSTSASFEGWVGDCRCFGYDRTPGVAPQGVLGVGRCRRL
jgi:hypothetical protein